MFLFPSRLFVCSTSSSNQSSFRYGKMRFVLTARMFVLLTSACFLLTTAQRPPASEEAGSGKQVSPAGARRPLIDTDGAIYQKTVGGVTFRIVVLCQDFEVLMEQNTLEFDTVQNGCRFTVTFPPPPRRPRKIRKSRVRRPAPRRSNHYVKHNAAKRQTQYQSRSRSTNPYMTL